MSEIPEAAKWRGGPSRELARTIIALTATDAHGRRYYRRSLSDATWRRLRGKDRAAWADLNASIDHYRPILQVIKTLYGP
jgi:hypothetical protein